MKKLSHISVVDIAVHFWRVGLPFAAMSSKVDYKVVSLILLSHLGWTNELNNVPRRRQYEIVWKGQRLDLRFRKMLQTEQKSTDLLQEIIYKSTKPGDVISDACCRSIATGRACLLLPRNR